jgi:hypothetical protein
MRIPNTTFLFLIPRVVAPDPDPHLFELLEPDPDPGGQKLHTNIEKEFLCFKVLDVFF